MNTPSIPEREHAVLGQKYAFAAASLMLGIASFINLLGFEKAVLAVAFGWLALKSLPGPALTLKRRWAKAGVILGLLHVLVLSIILLVARDRIGRLLEHLGDLSGTKREDAASSVALPNNAEWDSQSAAFDWLKRPSCSRPL
jgi:hypothetical protein